MMIQSVWKNLTGLQKAKFYSQLNTSGVTLNADLDPKIHHQWLIHMGKVFLDTSKIVATEVEIQFLNTQIMFPSLLPQVWNCIFENA